MSATTDPIDQWGASPYDGGERLVRARLAGAAAAQAELSDAAHKYRMASIRRRHAVQAAVAVGLTHALVADTLGISRVKVTKLVNGTDETEKNR